MPSTSTWRPAALRKKKNHLLDLPNELLLLIVDALPSPCPLLVAFPTLINLSSSLLERLDVSSDSREYAGHGGDITSWLALIHQHPVVADRIQELSVVFHNYKAPTDDRHKQCPSQILDETTEKCLALAQQFSINLESSFIDRLKVCQDEANFCLLLAVAPNIRRVHLVLEIQSPVDLADLADTFSPVFTLLRLQPRTLDGFHLCITKEQIEGPLEYAPVPCSNMASLLSTIFKLPVIKTFRISGPYDEAKGSGDYWAASLHPVNMEELSVNEDSWYRPSFIHRMLRCVSGLRRIDCEVSIDAVSWSPDGYKLYERALRPHQNTLVSLRLVIPSRFETQPKLYDWVYEQPSLGSLRNFTQLKRLEVSPCVLWDAYDIGIASVGPAGDPETLSINYEGEYAYPHMAHLELQDILPPSLHSFCVTWIDANVSKKLQDFIQYLVDTGDSPFADFAHLCDLCDFDRATAEQAINHDLEFIPAQGIQQLLRNAQDLSIKTFPEDSATFARTPFVNGEVRKNTKFPQDVHCVGGCR